MQKLTQEELLSINGGAVKASVLIAVGSAITFLVGIIDGFIRPYKCRS